MQSTCVYWLSAYTSVRFTGFATKSVSHCHPDGLIRLLLLLLLCVVCVVIDSVSAVVSGWINHSSSVLLSLWCLELCRSTLAPSHLRSTTAILGVVRRWRHTRRHARLPVTSAEGISSSPSSSSSLAAAAAMGNGKIYCTAVHPHGLCEAENYSQNPHIWKFKVFDRRGQYHVEYALEINLAITRN